MFLADGGEIHVQKEQRLYEARHRVGARAMGPPASLLCPNPMKRLPTLTLLSSLLVATIACKPTVKSPDRVQAVVNQPMSHDFSASRNPTSFGAEGLPDGLALQDADVPRISGTPTSPGIREVTLSATNKNGTGTKDIQIDVRKARAAVDPFRELVITHPNVLQSTRALDTSGSWHLKSTIARITGSSDNAVNSRFILDWLRLWAETEFLNDDARHTKRPAVESSLIDPWIADSGGDQNDLDWAQSPFRLNAVVNRLDLTRFEDDDITGNVTKLGEARLIYVAKNGRPFHVIFEFGIPGPTTRANVLSWARQWRDLSESAGFGGDYLDALEGLTDQFVKGTHLAPGRGQVRTNEILLDGVWQLREFHLRGGKLEPAFVALTPQGALNTSGNTTLIKFFEENRAAISAGKHTVPRAVDGVPFAAAVSNTPRTSFTWADQSANGISEHLRFQLSFNTCSGCHGADGPGVAFVHIRNVISDDPTNVLSPFLLGPQSVPLPDGTTEERDEMAGRAAILATLDAAGTQRLAASTAESNAVLKARGVRDPLPLNEYCNKALKERRNRAH